MDGGSLGLSDARGTSRQRHLFCRQLVNILAYWSDRAARYHGAWQELDADADHIARAVGLGLRLPEARQAACAVLAATCDFILRRAGTAFDNDVLALMATAATASAIRSQSDSSEDSPSVPFSAPEKDPDAALGLDEAVIVTELAGQLYQRRGLAKEAEQCYRQALASASAHQRFGLKARMQIELGRFLVEHGRAGEGTGLLEEGMAAARLNADQVVLLRGLVALALHYAQIHDASRALELLDQALPLAAEVGEPNYLGRVWVDLADVHWQMGAYADAQAALDQAAVYFELSGDRRLGILADFRMGIIHYEREEYREAVEHFQQAARDYEQIGDAHELAHVHQSLGAAYWGLQEWEGAEYHSLRALSLARKLESKIVQIEVLVNLVEIYAAQHKRSLAVEALADARAQTCPFLDMPDTARWARETLHELDTLEAQLSQPQQDH